jgi:hypothetical protein
MIIKMKLFSTLLAVVSGLGLEVLPAGAMPRDLPICKFLALRDTVKNIEDVEPVHLKKGTVHEMLSPIYWADMKTGRAEYCGGYDQGCVRARDVRLLDCKVIKKRIGKRIGANGDEVGYDVACDGCKLNR